jgi:hypothetical protein
VNGTLNALRRVTRALFTWLAALVILFEEWGWAPLARWVGRLARLPLFAWIERHIAALPPYAALVVFFIPALALLPVKLLALYWISLGHPVLGVSTIVVAKIAGTAIVARVFQLTQPSLMTLGWFAALYRRWSTWKARIVAAVRASAAWQSATRALHRARLQAEQLWRQWRHG